jgi:formylglycine-generating enzyme required for sulfatase activity
MIALAVIALGMIEIPAGEHQPFLNDPSGRPSPRVRVDRFWLDERAVTQREFLTFVVAHPEWRKSQAKRIFAEQRYLQSFPSDLSTGKAADGPITFVSWFAANAYCKARGARLPTTDEWEYAANAGGRDPKTLSAQTLAWYGKPTPAELPPAHGPKNTFGVADMAGSVWEWTLDFSSVMIAEDQRAGGEKSAALFCGGGGATGIDPSDYATFMRFAFRSSLKPTFTLGNLGFRCASSVLR